MLVYKNMLLPVIEYGDILLTGTTSVNKRKLQTIQNKCLRCALRRDKYSGSTELHKDAKLLKLKYRREQHLLNFMYDASLDPINLRKPKKIGVCTRSDSKKLLRVKRPRTEKYKKSLTYNGPKKWNALSEEIQKASTKELFRNQICNRILLKAERESTDTKDYV